MSEPVSIRLARQAELPRVGEVTVTAYRHDGHVEGDDGYAAELRDAEARFRDAELLVAVRGDAVLGTVTFCPPGSPFRELSQAGEAEFRMLGVAPEARGSGVGRRLVAACMARSQDLGLSAIVLCSLPQMLRAHALYESLGFRRDPHLDWEPAPGVTLLGFRLPL